MVRALGFTILCLLASLLARPVAGLLFALIPLAFSLGWCSVAVGAESPPTTSASCKECLRIRVGLPRVVRGPAPNIADGPFSEIQLPDGHYRGFTAAAETFAIDGDRPWEMGGPAKKVLARCAPGTYCSCGQWLQHAELFGKAVLGLIHDETECNYRANAQTHKSMSLAISRDYGLTWQSQGQIITGTELPTASKITGEGDCTLVNGQDGFYYAYCWRDRDGAFIVVRAPVSDFRPEKWMKFFQGKWEQPGLGGAATALGNAASASVALWTTTGQILGVDWRQGGISLSFSTDRVTFTTLPEPLVPFDEGRAWTRPAPVELDTYYALIDAKTGTNQLSDSWILTYLYIQPNEGLDQRYLVFRPVDMSVSNSPVTPQVGVKLGRWYNAALHDRWSTTAPVPGNYTSYKLENESGYLMTAASTAQPTVQLEECLSKWPGSRDRMIEAKGDCEQHGYGKLRLAGWAYSKPQAGTVPIYRCYDSQWHTHFVSNAPDCEKLGTPERLLGYALSQ